MPAPAPPPPTPPADPRATPAEIAAAMIEATAAKDWAGLEALRQYAATLAPAE